MVYFKAIWCILSEIWYIFHILVCCIKKDLAAQAFVLNVNQGVTWKKWLLENRLAPSHAK
jgi:hypothetical protein